MILQLAVTVESVWLATIYGHRMFEAFDRAHERLDVLLDDDLYGAQARHTNTLEEESKT